MLGARQKNLHKQRILPPQTRTTEEKKIERIRIQERLKRTERYAAREKYRRDTELYGDVFYNWDLIMQQGQEVMKEKGMKETK